MLSAAPNSPPSPAPHPSPWTVDVADYTPCFLLRVATLTSGRLGGLLSVRLFTSTEALASSSAAVGHFSLKRRRPPPIRRRRRLRWRRRSRTPN